MIDVGEVLVVTARVAVTSTLLALVPGVAVGWLLARRRFPGRTLVESIVTLPMVLPPVAVGLLLLSVLSEEGPLGRLGIHIVFTPWAAAVAALVMSFPLLVRAAQQAVAAVPASLEHAAATLGATPWQVFRTITLPLSARGIVNGLLLTFARSLGEFGATILVAGNIPGRTQTLATGIYSAITANHEPDAWVLACLAAGLSLLATWLANVLVQGHPQPEA